MLDVYIGPGIGYHHRSARSRSRAHVLFAARAARLLLGQWWAGGHPAHAKHKVAAAAAAPSQAGQEEKKAQ